MINHSANVKVACHQFYLSSQHKKWPVQLWCVCFNNVLSVSHIEIPPQMLWFRRFNRKWKWYWMRIFPWNEIRFLWFSVGFTFLFLFASASSSSTHSKMIQNKILWKCRYIFHGITRPFYLLVDLVGVAMTKYKMNIRLNHCSVSVRHWDRQDLLEVTSSLNSG